MLVGFARLQELEGVDGFAFISNDFQVIDAKLPSFVATEQIIESIQASFALADYNMQSGIRQKILLSDEGVWHFSANKDGYLAVIAGVNEPVDVAELNSLVENMSI